ncbi:unnamed protein product [Chrysodeixis includens]|uniref:Uncharacterized protein n=1 Tax=Chrysodeixis includens TaxID=689277 RepID=A0A9P0C632_CHRIL|nr:unnamed protein product [Chrysodeixis includens]
MLKLATIALGLLQVACAMPASSLTLEDMMVLEDLMMVDDTESVGSYIRETRAAAPQGYHKSVHDEGDGEIGYSRKKTGGGKKGYQHFDAYHKKAGDNYEFEKQDSYGDEDKGQDGAYSHNHEATVEREREPEEFGYEEEERPKRKQKQQHKEITHSELKEGADDGNGGVESFGHDPRDYTLPEKYTWGEEADTEQ